MSQNFTPPVKGSMFLFDYIKPPLAPDSYRLHVSTDVTFDGDTHKLEEDRYFDVVGPRFVLQNSDIAAISPPRNGRGPFHAQLAQIALRRRTLPWERQLDKNNQIGQPSGANTLPSDYPVPWMALLIFEEGEYTLLENVPLETVVPGTVFQKMGSPANVLCSAVEAPKPLVKSILPSKEELQLLTHVRWVNIEDRELNVEGSDGWFAIVMTNRLPSPGKKCRACLVSLEERTDLVDRDPPPAVSLPDAPGRTAAPFLFDVIDREFVSNNRAPGRLKVSERRTDPWIGKLTLAPANARLVLLYSWQFLCEGTGTFYNLMQDLDVGMIGKTLKAGQPDLTDTGHLRLTLEDRAGTEEIAWYRGPLVPFELTRDPLGPYHSADQARRAAPETGAEDISYAAAFEVGRLLAAADARLAQELMRWRREMYRQSARAAVISTLELMIQLNLSGLVVEKIEQALIPFVATASIREIVVGAGPISDRYGLNTVGRSVGLQPEVVRDVWKLASIAEAQIVLGGVAGTFGMEAAPPPATKREFADLNKILSDVKNAAYLQSARTRLIDNIKVKLGGK